MEHDRAGASRSHENEFHPQLRLWAVQERLCRSPLHLVIRVSVYQGGCCKDTESLCLGAGSEGGMDLSALPTSLLHTTSIPLILSMQAVIAYRRILFWRNQKEGRTFAILSPRGLSRPICLVSSRSRVAILAAKLGRPIQHVEYMITELVPKSGKPPGKHNTMYLVMWSYRL